MRLRPHHQNSIATHDRRSSCKTTRYGAFIAYNIGADSKAQEESPHGVSVVRSSCGIQSPGSHHSSVRLARLWATSAPPKQQIDVCPSPSPAVSAHPAAITGGKGGGESTRRWQTRTVIGPLELRAAAETGSPPTLRHLIPDRYTDRQTDRQRDRTDRQTDRQTETRRMGKGDDGGEFIKKLPVSPRLASHDHLAQV